MDCVVHAVTKSRTRLSHFHFHRASLVAQTVKNPLAVQETRVGFLGREDLLEKGWATHSSVPGPPLWPSC